MAATIIENTVMKHNQAVSMPVAAAVDATDGAVVNFNAADQKILLILQNASTSVPKTATVKAGNGIQGVNDLVITLEASTTKLVSLESGKFMNMKGTAKGKVIVKGSDANVKAACVVLP
jgi:hypothetical protein